MAVISFGRNEPEKTWCVAAWAFRQLLDDVMSQYPADKEMADKFEQSITHSGLQVRLLNPALASKITGAIRQVATGILSGAIRSGIHDQPYGDATTVGQYRNGLRELLKAIPDSDDE